MVVYRAAQAARFPPEVRAALEQGGIDGVLHFSRRSVESYLDCSRDIVGPALKPVHYCLSARAAEPLRLAGAGRIRGGRAAGRGEPARFGHVQGHAKAQFESSRMTAWPDEKRPPDPQSTRRRRPPTVIDLPATEVPPRIRRAGGDAVPPPSEPPQPSRHPSRDRHRRRREPPRAEPGAAARAAVRPFAFLPEQLPWSHAGAAIAGVGRRVAGGAAAVARRRILAAAASRRSI